MKYTMDEERTTTTTTAQLLCKRPRLLKKLLNVVDLTEKLVDLEVVFFPLFFSFSFYTTLFNLLCNSIDHNIVFVQRDICFYFFHRDRWIDR